MVLKKSNSHLNTGVTQRFTNRGAIQQYSNTSLNHGTIFIFLEGHEDGSSETRSKFQETLDTVYNFLEWQGPDISLYFSDEDSRPKIQSVFNEFNYLKHHTIGSSMMSEKIRKLTVANILEPTAQTVEVEITIKKYVFPKAFNQTVFSWKSTNRINQKSNIKDDKKLRRKENHNCHHRGIQRQKRISHEKQEELLNSPSRKIQIIVQEPYVNDARLVTKAEVEYRPGEMTGTTLWKRKGFVNGCRSYFKGYNCETLKLDEMEAICDGQYCYYNYNNSEDVWDSRDFAEEEENLNFNESIEDENLIIPLPVNRICLADFMMPTNKIEINCTSSKEKKTKFVPVNPASSEMVIRQTKSIFEFVLKKDPDEGDQDSGFETNSSASESMTDDQEQEEYVADVTEGDNFQLDLALSISHLFSRYVMIDLILPSKFMTELDNIHPVCDFGHNETYSVGDCYITFGHCYPPVFEVKMNTEKHIYDHEWYLTGKAIKLSHSNAYTWHLHIANMKIWDPDVDKGIEDRFFSTLHMKFSNEITLQNLIELFQESIENTLIVHSVNTSNSKPSVHCSVTKSTWHTLQDLMSSCNCIVRTVSVEEALHNPSFEENVKVNVARYSSHEVEDDLASLTCDICFISFDFSQLGESNALALTSCGHVFCFSCWRSHVLIGLRGGDPIRCMESDCKQELNETILRSLVPGHMVKKWSQRVRNREIERNAMCKWCPNTHCDKVALVPELSTEINQFGNVVLCDCQTRWCFSCQDEPHWPASCEQIAAARKLLCKIDRDFMVPSSRITFTIELKPCPKCRYPIEKNEGCPSMVCRMCWFNFCWNCLKSVDHSVYNCKARTDNFVTYNLQNEVVHSLPLKFFQDFLEMNRNRQKIEKRNISTWLHSIRRDKKLIRIPLRLTLQLANSDIAKEDAIIVADRSVQFLKDVYTFLEPYYILLSFVKMNKTKSPQLIIFICQELATLTDCLRFVSWRLEERIIHKRLQSIMCQTNTANMLLDLGTESLNKFKKYIHILQRLSKDIDTSLIGDLDPNDVLRYR